MALARELSYLDVRPLLVRLSDLDRSLVLVGGQAVNFWSWRYHRRRAEIRENVPFTSKDVDFCGDRKVVRVCAERLSGEAEFPSLDHVVTPNTGVVFFTDPGGVRRRIDILGELFGVDGSRVQKTAVAADLLDDQGASTGSRFYVMHPVLVLESRVHNVAGLPDQYNNPKGLKQLRLSIVCAQEFMRDVLDRMIPSENPVRAVLKLNERVARFCTEDRHAKDVYARHGLDPAAALLVDDRLPSPFLSKRLPQLQAQLAARPGRGTERAQSPRRNDDDLSR